MLVEPWRITLFGGLKAEQSDVSITRFRTRKAASLFAFLACCSQRDHAREELAERFWPDDAPETARQKLRLALTSLRHQLEPDGTQTGTVLFADRSHLRLNAHAIETDVAAFEAGLRAARFTAAPAARFDLLARALLLYTGDLLPGDYEEWAQQERERLKGAYIAALGQAVALGVELCHEEQATDYARRLIAADPLQEDAHLALMRLYAGANRPAESLKQYKQLQTLLRETLNADPGEEAQTFAAQLRGANRGLSGTKNKLCQTAAVQTAPVPDAPAAAPASVPLPAAKPAPAAPRLPLFLTRCFGRESDIRALTALFASSPARRTEPSDADTDLDTAAAFAPRLVTLTGPGGAGKTRLAVEVAARLQKQNDILIAFVPLADVTEPGRIARAIADALRLPRIEGADVTAQVADYLQNAPALFVLDNFEQLTPGGANIVHALLARLPGLRCLVTSRHHVGLAGERTYPVPPLPPVPGAQMFVDRAQAVRADFQITDRNAQAVADLCEQMEGIPLAIELCAAWIGVLSPAQMLAKRAQRFDLLVSRRPDRVARHQALRATIAWSYDLLPPELQAFFCRLSVFQGGWTGAAAQAVCDAPHALHLLAQLRERSLVTLEESGECRQSAVPSNICDDEEARANAGDTRFRLLDSLREFAQDNLDAPERARTRRAHADYYTQLAQTAHSRLEGPEQAFWFACLEREHNNLRAALDTCMQRRDDTRCEAEDAIGCHITDESGAQAEHAAEDRTEQALRLALAMRLFWRARGYLSEGRQRLEAILALPGVERHPELLCVAQIEMGLLTCTQGDTDRAREYLNHALPIARREGEEQAVASALNTLGNVALRLGEYAEAERLYSECAARAQRIGYLRLYASTLGNLGNVFWRQEKMEEARFHYEASLRAQRSLANKQGILIALYNLGAMVGQTGDWDGAVTYLAECLTLCRDIGDLTNGVYALEVFGHIAEERTKWARAARLYAAAAQLRERLGTPMTDRGRASQAERLATLRRELGDAPFETAWHLGKSADLEQSIAFALQAVPPAAPADTRRTA